MTETDIITVALFPIPDVVAFPGTVLPLHVFEPRYRKLVHESVRDQRMVAVSHVERTIHEPQHKAQTLEDALSSNLATYQPRAVFCAGPCNIVQTTEDGRIIVEITMSHRLSLVDEVQSLPYRIVRCTVLADREPTAPRTDSAELKRLIHSRLVAHVSGQNAELGRELDSDAWADMTPSDYSFRIFQILHFDAELSQSILEAQSANARLELIWDVLRRA